MKTDVEVDTQPADAAHPECIELILHAGSARAAFSRAIERARHQDFARAHVLMDEGRGELALASAAQTKILASSVRGTAHLDLILVHAQDHLMMAKGLEPQAEELVNIYELLSTVGAREGGSA